MLSKVLKIENRPSRRIFLQGKELFLENHKNENNNKQYAVDPVIQFCQESLLRPKVFTETNRQRES